MWADLLFGIFFIKKILIKIMIKKKNSANENPIRVKIGTQHYQMSSSILPSWLGLRPPRMPSYWVQFFFRL
jgi:hypothetical protein